MKKKKIAKLPSIKKDIESFINEEEGAISKKDALSMGLSFVMLGAVLAETALAQQHSSHTNTTHSAHSSTDIPTHNQHASAFANEAARGVHVSNTPHTSCHNSAPVSNCHSDSTSHTNVIPPAHNNGGGHSNCSSCHSSCGSGCHGAHGSHSSCHSSNCHSDNCSTNCHSSSGSCHSSHSSD